MLIVFFAVAIGLSALVSVAVTMNLQLNPKDRKGIQEQLVQRAQRGRQKQLDHTDQKELQEQPGRKGNKTFRAFKVHRGYG